MTAFDPTTLRPETLALHAGQAPDAATNARAVSIYATTSYVFNGGLEHADDLIADLEQGLGAATEPLSAAKPEIDGPLAGTVAS